ncbi:MAG TPA: hypothetical protein ENJ71_04540 [Epsilonproteobacteria bacterium]|nr:hypothetical protein [Campylobacterota bacterium]
MHLLKEVKIFLSLFLLLSLAMHFQAWLDHPLAHIKSLSGSPMGLWHPFWITAVVYIVLLLFRLVWRTGKRVFG